MSAGALFDFLRLSGFALQADGDRLLVTPAGALTEELRAQIRAHKAALLRWATPVAGNPPEPLAGTCAGCGRYAWRPAGASRHGWRCAICSDAAVSRESRGPPVDW